MSDKDDQFRSRFQVKGELGRGGMGEVHLAYDHFLQRDVAIKLARHALLQDPQHGQRNRRMWLNETRLAGKLHHPYIVETFEAGLTDEFGYLVMEYVPAGPLTQFTTADKLLPVESVIEIVYKVCNALDYASKMGLLHRDVKPANVLLADRATPKIVDFGTCYMLNAEVTQVLEVGTLPFAAPENFRNATPTVQSDIYAAGVMTYQLLTGTYPFQASTYDEMVYKKLHEDFTPLETRRRDIPSALRFAVHRALQRSRELRYETWSEFYDALALALPALERPREVVFETARFATLKQLSFSAGFTDSELWETIRLSKWIDKAPYEKICEEGAVGRSIYIVASGEVAVTRGGVVLNSLKVGECFGEMAFIEEESQTRSATAVAMTPLVLIEIDADSLRAASSALQSAFGRAFMRVMVSRLKAANQRLLETIGVRP